MTSNVQKPLTYADAGVSIAAGNALVKAIAPLAKIDRAARRQCRARRIRRLLRPQGGRL